MKILIFLTILLFSAISQASAPPSDVYWVCHQVGTMSVGKKGATDNTLVISHIHADHYTDNYAERMFQFHQQIKSETKGKFLGQFEPKCIYFEDGKKAIQFRDKNILRAKHNNYHILHLDFKYDPNKSGQQKQMPLY